MYDFSESSRTVRPMAIIVRFLEVRFGENDHFGGGGGGGGGGINLRYNFFLK